MRPNDVEHERLSGLTRDRKLRLEGTALSLMRVRRQAIAKVETRLSHCDAIPERASKNRKLAVNFHVREFGGPPRMKTEHGNDGPAITGSKRALPLPICGIGSTQQKAINPGCTSARKNPL
jgi:hypothetical protein